MLVYTMPFLFYLIPLIGGDFDLAFMHGLYVIKKQGLHNIRNP